MDIERSFDKHDLEDRMDLRLFSSIKLESGGADGLAGLYGDGDVCLQSLLPWLQECSPDRFIVIEPGRSDLLPGSTIRGDCRRKLVILGGCREVGDRDQGSPVESVGESLVLDRFWFHRGRSREVGSLEVGSREIGNGCANSRREISD